MNKDTWQRVTAYLRHKVFRRFETERTDERSAWAITMHFEPDGLDGGYTAWCDEFPGAVSQGDTPHEALANLVDAVSEVIAYRMAESLPPVSDDEQPVRVLLSA